jgi:DNA-directed RNA polymerase subunit RPC12/RpoP
MAEIDLVCLDCKHAFGIVTRATIKEKQKRCPECGSRHVRQKLASFLRNGPLSAPDCGAERTSYG